MANQLLGIHFDEEGVRMPHFLNGRLLTASDLQAAQEATLTRLRHLGEAAGFGVVDGLVVSRGAGANSLHISGGIGLNRAGDLIHLGAQGAQISVTLAPDTKAYGEDAGRFHRCRVVAPVIESGKGAYLLTIRPLSRLEEFAPVKSMRGNLATCASKWEKEGVEFLAIPLTNFTLVGGAMERNLLAHWCFGSEALKKVPSNPFELGLTSYLKLHPSTLPGLEDCDLPLAVFTRTPQGLEILDNWSARRRIVYGYPAAGWDAFVSDTRIAEAQARFLQFQEQLEQIRTTHKPAAVVATDHFRYLPPVGFLPIQMPPQIVAQVAREVLTTFFTRARATDLLRRLIDGNKERATLVELLFQAFIDQHSSVLAANTLSYLGGSNGFDLATFFGDHMPDRYALAPRETVDFTLNHSWHDEVIDLHEGTPFDIFLVDEALTWLAAKVRYVLLLMLDARKIQLDPQQFPEFVRTFDLLPARLLAELWGKSELRKEFAATTTQEAATFPFYVMFVKRTGPLRWVNLPREVADQAPKPDDEIIRDEIIKIDQLARWVTQVARTMKLEEPEQFERIARPEPKVRSFAAAVDEVVEKATSAAFEAATKQATELVTKAAVESAVAAVTERVKVVTQAIAPEPAPEAVTRAATEAVIEAATGVASEVASEATPATTAAKRPRTRRQAKP